MELYEETQKRTVKMLGQRLLKIQGGRTTTPLVEKIAVLKNFKGRYRQMTKLEKIEKVLAVYPEADIDIWCHTYRARTYAEALYVASGLKTALGKDEWVVEERENSIKLESTDDSDLEVYIFYGDVALL